MEQFRRLLGIFFLLTFGCEIHAAEDLIEIMRTYCIGCHSSIVEQSFAPDGTPNISFMVKVAGLVESGFMPPHTAGVPDLAARGRFVADIHSTIARSAATLPVTTSLLGRLSNRFVMSYLTKKLGVSPTSSLKLPDDSRTDGFDNVASSLFVSPIWLNNYTEIVDSMLDRSIIDAAEIENFDLNIPAKAFENGAYDDRGFLWLNSTGSYGFKRVVTPLAGTYRFTIKTHGTFAGDESPKFLVECGGSVVGFGTVTTTDIVGTDTEFTFGLSNGVCPLKITFLNDYFNPAEPDPNQRDRNLHLNSVRIRGPINGSAIVPRGSRVYSVCDAGEDGSTCLQKVLDVAKKDLLLFDPDRRLSDLPGQVEEQFQNMSRIDKIKQLLLTLFTSPQFIYRNLADARTDQFPSETSLASRLAQFLIFDEPDQRLKTLADNGELRSKLGSEVARLLKHPRALNFFDSFV